MGELIPTFFVLCIGAVAAASWARRFTTREQQLIMASLGAHALAACAQVWITRDYYGIGDMLLYHETGVELARLIRFDPGRFLPEVASLLYHERPYLPVFVLGAGGSSGVPSAVAGLLATCPRASFMMWAFTDNTPPASTTASARSMGDVAWKFVVK